VEREQQKYVSDYADFKTRMRAGDLIIPSFHLEEPLFIEIDHFMDCITSNTAPLSDGRQGLEITCVLEALTRSTKSGGHEVLVEYPELTP